MDADRRRILRWLEAKAPALAPVYDGAVRMILEPEFPGRVHFVAHAIREIMNRLPDAFITKDQKDKIGYRELVDKIKTSWMPTKLDNNQIIISTECSNDIEILFEAHRVPNESNRSRAEQLFEIIVDNMQPAYTDMIDLWMLTRRGGEEKTHVGSPKNPTPEGSIVEHFNNLEKILKFFSSKSYEETDKLDEILDTTYD